MKTKRKSALSKVLPFIFLGITAAAFLLCLIFMLPTKETSGYSYKTPNCTVIPTVYDSSVVSTLKTAKEIDAYAKDVYDYNKNIPNNKPVDKGIISSPYYTLTVNGSSVPVYATRTGNGIHSFSYLDIEVDDASVPFNLNVTIFATSFSSVFNGGASTTVVCLPESRGINTEINYSKKQVSATISEFGSFSFAFNVSHVEPLTIFVNQNEDTEKLFSGYSVVDIYADNVAYGAQLSYSQGNTAYVLHKGVYCLDSIYVPSDSIVYFERGAYVKVFPVSKTYDSNGNPSLSTGSRDFMYMYNRKNVIVGGRGLIDYSLCCGSETFDSKFIPDKGGLNFVYVDNISVSGITVINSPSWTLCYTACSNSEVHNVMLLGYRVFSDGIMMSNCQNTLVRDNFIRTGDDSCEVKSTGTAEMSPTDNVIFRNNVSWTDKANAFGCIFESVHSTRNVVFENCSVGFALATWSEHLGCCEIQMGDNSEAYMENVMFKDIEIYYSSNKALINCYVNQVGGTVKNIYYRNVIAKHNQSSYIVNLKTANDSTMFIYDLYFDNVISNGTRLTADNAKTYVNADVYGGFDFSLLHFETYQQMQPTLKYGGNGVFDYYIDHWTAQGNRVRGETYGKWYFGYGDFSVGGYTFNQTINNSEKSFNNGNSHSFYFGTTTTTRLYPVQKTQSIFKWISEECGTVEFSGLISKHLSEPYVYAVSMPWINFNTGTDAYKWYDGASFTISVYKVDGVSDAVTEIDQITYTSAFRYNIPSKKYTVKSGDAFYFCIKCNSFGSSGSEWYTNCLTLLSSSFEKYSEERVYPLSNIDSYSSHMTAQNVYNDGQSSGKWRYVYGTVDTSGYSATELNYDTSVTGDKKRFSSGSPNMICWGSTVTTMTSRATMFEWTAENSGSVSFTGLISKADGDKGVLAGKTYGYLPLNLSGRFSGNEFGFRKGDSYTVGFYKVSSDGKVTVISEETFEDDYAWLPPTEKFKVKKNEKLVFALKCDRTVNEWETQTCMILKADFKESNFSLATVFGDNMVLQKNRPVKIYGYSESNTKITVSFNGQKKTSVSDGEGHFSVILSSMPKISQGQTLTVSDGSSVISLNNVKVGRTVLVGGGDGVKVTFRETLYERNLVQSGTPLSTYILSRSVFKDYMDYNSYGNLSVFDADVDTERGWATFSSLSDCLDYSAYALGVGLKLAEIFNEPTGIIICGEKGSSIEQWLSPEAINENSLSLHYDQNLKPASSLYTSKLEKILSFAIDGVIWYQGEADAGYGGDGETTLKWVTDWKKGVKELIYIIRNEQGNIPFILQEIAQYDNWCPLKYIRLAAYEICSELKGVYVSSGISFGDELPDYVTDRFSQSEISAKTLSYAYAMGYETDVLVSVGDINEARLAYDNGDVSSLPIKAFKYGSSLLIDYGIGNAKNKLYLKEGNIVNNLECYDGTNWVTVSNATINGNIIFVPDAKLFTKVRYAAYNVMKNSATSLINRAFNSDSPVNLFTFGGLPCAPFEIDVTSGTYGVKATITSDLRLSYYLNVKTAYEKNVSLTFTRDGLDKTLKIEGVKDSSGAYVFSSCENDSVSVSPQDIVDKFYITGGTFKNYIYEDHFDLSNWDRANGFSVKDYLLLLKTSYSDDKTSALVVNLLNYGAAAQQYLSHDTDSLANDCLTASELQEYSIHYSEEEVNNNSVRNLSGDSMNSAFFSSIGIYYDNKLGLAVKFKVSASLNENVSLEISSAGFTLLTLNELSFTVDGDYRVYSAKFNDITPLELKKVFSFRIKSNGEYVGKTLNYNIYANINSFASQNNSYSDLVKALYSYGKAAENYLS